VRGTGFAIRTAGLRPKQWSAIKVSKTGDKEITMKRIEAIIRPEKASEVCAALDKVGHPGVTLSQVEGHGDQRKAWVNIVRGMSYKVSLQNKTRVEVVVRDEDADRIIKAIRAAALTGEVGDGKIFVHEMADAIRIRTNESGLAAI
jgi:nitrogen regulatory protein P-II 1